MLTKEQRDKIIQKIIDDENEEVLFNKLGLSIHEIFVSELEKKSDADLLDFILD